MTTPTIRTKQGFAALLETLSSGTQYANLKPFKSLPCNSKAEYDAYFDFQPFEIIEHFDYQAPSLSRDYSIPITNLVSSKVLYEY